MTAVLIGRDDLPAMMDGAPALVVLEGVAQPERLAARGPAVWIAHAVEDGLLLARSGREPAGAPLPLPLAPPGVLAVVTPSAAAAAPLAAWARTVSGVEWPVIEAATAGGAGLPLSRLLLAALERARSGLGDAQRALAALRVEAEETRVAMGAVLRSLGHRLPAAPQLARPAMPDAAGLGAHPAEGVLRLYQRLGLPVREVTAVGLHLAAASFGAASWLRVRLLAAESGRVVGSWLLVGDALEPGWLTLDLPAPVVALRETALLEVRAELAEGDALALSLEALASPGEGALDVPEGRADAADRALAVKVWTAPAGARFVLARHWNGAEVGQTLPESGLPYQLPSAEWGRTCLIEGRGHGVALGTEAARPVALLEGPGRSLLGSPVLRVDGMDVVRVQLAMLSPAAGPVEAAIWLRDAATLERLDAPVEDAPVLRCSGWRAFAAEGGLCDIELPLPLAVQGLVQVVVGVRTGLMDSPRPCAVEVRSIAALHLGHAAPAAPNRFRPVELAPAARFEDARLNDRHIGATGYRHLDITVQGFVTAHEAWRELRFKFSTTREGIPALEFRLGRGWPKIFEDWPSAQSDRFGPIFRFSAPEAVKVLAPLKARRDGRLLLGLLEVLPPVLEEVVARRNDPPEELATWTEAAARMAAVLPAVMEAPIPAVAPAATPAVAATVEPPAEKPAEVAQPAEPAPAAAPTSAPEPARAKAAAKAGGTGPAVPSKAAPAKPPAPAPAEPAAPAAPAAKAAAVAGEAPAEGQEPAAPER